MATRAIYATRLVCDRHRFASYSSCCSDISQAAGCCDDHFGFRAGVQWYQFVESQGPAPVGFVLQRLATAAGPQRGFVVVLRIQQKPRLNWLCRLAVCLALVSR